MSELMNSILQFLLLVAVFFAAVVVLSIAFRRRAEKVRRAQLPPRVPADPAATPRPVVTEEQLRYTPQTISTTLNTAPTPEQLEFAARLRGFQPPARAMPASLSPSTPRPASAKPKSTTLNLDPGDFAAATPEQTRKAAAAGGNLFANFSFGLRDRIPPASDPRTLIIDRAMVGHGLVTAEQLVEIHKVGEEMSRYSTDIAEAHKIADEKIRALEDDRKQLKLRKQAEAKERKEKRKAAIAHRRQTDIVFLGRGVSRRLADRRANVEKLTAAGLPILATPADMAAALDITIPRLRWLAFHSDAATVTHYVRFTVPKRSGGTRTLFAPHHDLAAAQQWVLENILAKVPVHPSAHGFVAGRSTVTNAAAHVGKAVVVNADLTDFFPTITFPRVRGLFGLLGFSPAVATILALLCTECPRRLVTYAGKPFHVATGPRGLPQGACTSPALSNLAARKLDARLAGIATKLGWNYSRYADDLTFSADGDAAQKVGYVLARIRHIAQDEGFVVNEKKTRVQRRTVAQSVTGIIVNDRPGVPRDLARRMRAILHRAKTEGLPAQNREKRPNFEAWVGGMIAYISMVNPKQAKPLEEALAALSRPQ